MTLRDLWLSARRELSSRGIPEAALEAEVLLRSALGWNRAELFSRWDEEPPAEAVAGFRSRLVRRLAREPTAYIVGKREFYGLEFYVDRRVIIPRPESELPVEQAVELLRDHFSPLIAEVGTGSGAIAIALACHLPRAYIYATDLSPEALEVARINRERHGLLGRVKLLLGDMLLPLPRPVDLVVANLPYIPTAELARLEPEIREYEPLIALDGGEDGVEAIRRLLGQLPGRLLPGGGLVLEVGAGQAPEVTALVRRRFPGCQLQVLADPAGIPRCLVVSNFSTLTPFPLSLEGEGEEIDKRGYAPLELPLKGRKG